MKVRASHIAVASFFAAVVLPRATWPLTDGDIWWHLRAGETALDTGRVPSVDTWSIAGEGNTWTSQDWLANVAMAGLHRLGPWGDTAMSLGFGVVALAAIGLLWWGISVREPRTGWLSRIMWLSLGLVLSSVAMGARVQMFDLFFSASVLVITWSYVARPRAFLLVLLPVLATLWANLHAGWLLLFLIGGAEVVGQLIDHLVGREQGRAGRLALRDLRWLTLALLASLGAVAINPNGFDLYSYPFDTVSIDILRRHIVEWYPASLDSLFGQLLVVFLGVTLAPALILGWRRLRTGDILVGLGLAVMAFSAIRFFLIAGPIIAAIAAFSVSPRLSEVKAVEGLGRMVSRLSSPSAGSARWIHLSLVAAVILLGTGLTVARVAPSEQERAVSRGMPDQAVDWLAGHDAGDRIFNDYDWGGYLGYRIPSKPVFIDGRTDVYGESALADYLSVVSLSDDPQVVFSRYGIDHVLFPESTPLAKWLDTSPSWRRAYGDGVAGVWIRH